MISYYDIDYKFINGRRQGKGGKTTLRLQHRSKPAEEESTTKSHLTLMVAKLSHNVTKIGQVCGKENPKDIA
jgi:hypothetical protein